MVVPTAVALGGRIAGWFEGKPAPPAVRQDFVQFNAAMTMSAYLARSGFARKTPQAVAARAHGVLALRTADGPVYLWAAPRRGGGSCWLLQLGSLTNAACDQTWPSSERLTFDTFGGTLISGQFIYGRALGGAARVVVDLSDGERTTLPVAEGLFMGAIPKHVHALEVAAYDASGKRLVAFGTLAGGTAPLSAPERRALSRVSARGKPYPLPVHDPLRPPPDRGRVRAHGGAARDPRRPQTTSGCR